MEIIDVARWLAENHEELSALVNKYAASEDQKVEALIKLVRKAHPSLGYEDVSIMFEDDKLRLILDRYYLKPLH